MTCALGGIKDLDVDDLVKCFDHGVTPEFLHSLRKSGLKDLDLDDLVKCFDHGVTPEFLRGHARCRGQGL